MSEFEGPRGLRGYARFETPSDEKVEIQESSSVHSFTINGEFPGPFLWLRVDRGDSATFAHLNRENAVELRDGLNKFLEQFPEEES